MPNVTISLDERTLAKGREYAKKHRTTLNGLIRKVLDETIHSGSSVWLDECFDLMDKARSDSKGKKWKKEDLHVR